MNSLILTFIVFKQKICPQSNLIYMCICNVTGYTSLAVHYDTWLYLAMISVHIRL